MAENGTSGSIWKTLKSSLSMRNSYESEDHRHDTKAPVHKRSGDMLSDSEINGLPPLQQNGISSSQTSSSAQSLPQDQQPKEYPHKNQRRSNSWLSRLSSIRRSSEGPPGPTDETTSIRRSSEIGSRADAAAEGPHSKDGGLQGNVRAKGTSQRDEFLAAYDSATLELCNRLSGESASCLGDTAFQDVAPWNRQPGFLGHLNGQQEQALREMKSAFPESRQWHTDHDLLRFLRARDFDVRKAKEMYNKYIAEYRGKCMVSPNPPIRPTVGELFDVDLINLYPERDRILTEKLQKMMQWFLHTVAFGTDKDGRPVIYFRPGDIFSQKMTKFVPVADRIAFQSTSNEMLCILTKMASHKAGYHIDSITQVLDLGGIGAMQIVSHMRNADAQQEWQHNMDYHPELLHRIFVISAPSGMPLVWKVASPFLPAATKRKVEILGSDYHKVLEKAIGRQNLPSCYGGTIPFEWQPHKKIKELKY